MTVTAILNKPGRRRKAKSNTASGAAQGPIGNTAGVFIPRVKPNVSGGATKVPIVPASDEEKSFLEKKQEQLQGKIDDWVESRGDSKAAMASGALATALNQVLFPTAMYELIPFGKAFKLVKKGAQVAGLSKNATKAIPPASARRTATQTKEAKKAGGGSGGFIPGEDPGGRCKLRPHSELTDKNSPHKCGPGMDSHHVVANRTFQKAAGRKGNLMKGGVPEADGLAICLETNKNGPKSEHVLAHKEYDKAEKLLAKDPASPEGLAELGKLEKKAGDAIEKATGGKCSSANISRQLREYHMKRFKLYSKTLVRASKNPNSMLDKAVKAMGKLGQTKR